MANKRLIDLDNTISHYKALANIEWNKRVSPVSWADAYDEFIEYLEEAPTVDAVEVVHGEWEMGLDEGDYEYGTCSVCGYNEYNAFCCLLPHNYCPNCGAKMDGGNEDGNLETEYKVTHWMPLPQPPKGE